MKTALLLVNALCLTIGICGGPMVTRLYFIHGGKRVWLASTLEGAGWPINLTVLFIIYLRRRHKEGPAAKLVFMRGRLFIGAAITGILSGVDYFLYVYGVARLPISTSSLVAGTHLTFVALFAFVLVKQRFTPYSINAVVLLSVGAGVLGIHTISDRPKGESSREYYHGFFMTIADAVLFGFILPFMELSYKKARQDVTSTLVLEFQLVMSFIATIVGTIGMILNNDFTAIPREARDFGLGEIMYYVVLLCNAVFWQCAFLGSIGVTFVGSALLSAIIITIALQGTEVLGVILYKEKFSVEKGVALVLSLWGFFSYFYGLRNTFTLDSQSGGSSILPRTSPRKAGVPTIDLDKVNPHERFSWDSDKTRCFLQVLLQEIEQEGRTTLGFDSAAWNRIATNLSARIKEVVSKKQCTNKYDDLLNDWKAWDFLFKDRSLTGLGRDPNTGAITAPDHQWKQWCSNDKKVAKFRKNPLEHPELMERVFQKVTHSGKGVYTAGGDNTQFFEVDESEESSMAEKGFGADDVRLDPFESPQSDLGNPRLQSGSTSKGKKRKKLSSSDRLSESLCNVLEDLKNTIKNNMVIEHKHETPHTIISEGMNTLHEMMAFKDPANLDIKMWVLALLESSPAKWSIFSNLKSNGERMHWLQRQYIQERRQHIQERLAFQRSGAMLGGDEPPPGIFPPPPYDD